MYMRVDYLSIYQERRYRRGRKAGAPNSEELGAKSPQPESPSPSKMNMFSSVDKEYII